MARATLFQDLFTGADGTEVHNAYNGWWATAFSNLELRTNRLNSINNGTTKIRGLRNAGAQANAQLYADVTRPALGTFGSNYYTGLLARVTATGTLNPCIELWIQYTGTGTATLRLIEMGPTGIQITVAETATDAVTWAAGAQRRLVLTLEGAEISAHIEPAGGGVASHALSLTATVVATGEYAGVTWRTQSNIHGHQWDNFTLQGPDIEPTCDLELEVYDDDGVSVLWAVGTAADHAAPYLVAPDRYAEQELDVAGGSAALGTVSVTVIDPPTTPGDQDSGWMTGKLRDTGGLANLAGRRCRLRRLLDTMGTDYVVLADGPAGMPGMDPSFAAFTWEIRDTRENERKLRAFSDGVVGTAHLLPEGGPEGGYGYDPDEDTWLLEPLEPLVGVWDATWPTDSSSGSLDLTVSNPPASRLISRDAYDKLAGSLSVKPFPMLLETTFGNRLLVKWRPAGSGDPWHEIADTLVLRGIGAFGSLAQDVTLGVKQYISGDFIELALAGKYDAAAVLVGTLMFGDTRVPPDVPTHGQSVEVLVAWRGAPTAERPYYLEGLTAGELAQALYDGTYSPRDQDGAVVPSGVRYDAAALALMTEPVRLRLDAEITDVRDWLEKHIYRPTGWCPALDAEGQVSPVSQIPPTDLAALPVIGDAEVEPGPDWRAGEQVINVIQFRYLRDYRPVDDDPEAPRELKGAISRFLSQRVAADPLAQREVVVEFEDPVSIARHNRQPLEIDGAAFRALGNGNGDAIGDGTEAETSWGLAQDRDQWLRTRYAYGAQTIPLAVLRSAAPALRAGDWVMLEVSWIPDYLTGRRGGTKLAQVIALGDLDCSWRQALFEVVRLRRQLEAEPGRYQALGWNAETEYVQIS